MNYIYGGKKMKKILAIAIVAVMAVALCVSANAQLNIDRLFINANDLNEGTDVKANDPIEINAGDKVYILGWAANPDGALTEIVWSVDGGEDQKCSDSYRDRSDVAGAGIAIADNGTHGGFGIDAAADGGMMELLGIGSVAAGAHTLSIKAIYADGTSEASDFNIVISGEAKAEDPGSTDDKPATNPKTADAAVIAIAAVAVVALAGVVVAKKVK